MNRPVKRDLGYVKPWENGMSRMTRFSRPVAVQTVISYFYYHANFMCRVQSQNLKALSSGLVMVFIHLT